jgi:hypothetical protein
MAEWGHCPGCGRSTIDGHLCGDCRRGGLPPAPRRGCRGLALCLLAAAIIATAGLAVWVLP